MRKSIMPGLMILMIGGLVMGWPNQGLPSRAHLNSPVPLNHFYIVLDSETYKAIEQDPFLRGEFAVSEVRTTTRTDISYTGVYFYGTNTYFEFFDAATTNIGKLADSGIALGVDTAGTLEIFKPPSSPVKSPSTAPAAKLTLLEAPITRAFAGKQLPWFYMAVPTNIPADAGFRFWVMEYHPRFLVEWNPDPDMKDPGVRRSEILQRYARVIKDTSPKPTSTRGKPYFGDVVAITIALNEVATKSLIELGRLLGYSERTNKDHSTLTGLDIELRIIPETPTVRGIQQITMRVTGKPAKQSVFRFGKSVLKFQGNDLATWTF